MPLDFTSSTHGRDNVCIASSNRERFPMAKQESLREIALLAGVTSSEMEEDPVLGLLLTASGARKIAAVSSDTAGKMKHLQLIHEVEGNSSG